MLERRTLGGWMFILLAWGGAGLILIGARRVFGLSSADYGTARVLIPTVATLIAMAWTFWWAGVAFRRLDEFQQAAGRFAWYWGGATGVAVSVVGYVFIGQGGLHWLDPSRFGMGQELFRAFQIGYVLGVGCPLVGFILARLWWQAAKR
jgi:hypothetical protein